MILIIRLGDIAAGNFPAQKKTYSLVEHKVCWENTVSIILHYYFSLYGGHHTKSGAHWNGRSQNIVGMSACFFAPFNHLRRAPALRRVLLCLVSKSLLKETRWHILLEAVRHAVVELQGYVQGGMKLRYATGTRLPHVWTKADRLP